MGVTPVDTAGGLLGLSNLVAVNQFMWTHHVYLVMFAIGLFVVGLQVAGQNKRGLDLFWVLVMNSMLITLFAANGRTATAGVAATGKQLQTVQELAGFTSVTGVPAGFHMIDEAETALTVGAIQLFKQVPGGSNFLNAPFKAQFIANEIALAQIRDPTARKEFFDFLGDCYAPALASWANDKGGEALKERLLPSRLVNYYKDLPSPSGTGTCLDRWTGTRDKIYQDGVDQGVIGKANWFRNLVGATTGTMENLSKGQLSVPNASDWYVDTLLQNYTTRAGSLEAIGVSTIANQTSSFSENPVGWAAGKAASWWGNYWTLTGMLNALIGAGPQVAGYTLSVMKGLFPFVLAFALMTVAYGELFRFFTYLLSVKMWFVGWAMVDAASTMSKKIFYSTMVSAGYNYSYYDTFSTALMYIGVPALMTYFIAGAGNSAASVLNRLSGHVPIGMFLKGVPP